jgi:hypothetical protein
VIYNIHKVQKINESELFKKLNGDIWEFRTQFLSKQIRLLAFWDKTSTEPRVIICTHGFVKKQWKVAEKELSKATSMMNRYYSFLQNENEKLFP